MQYSPKLKRAVEQIRKIMKDSDLAGFAVIHTPGYSEFILEITPKYSCAEWFPKHDGITIKGKLSHFNGDVKSRDLKLSNTINMLHHLSTVTMEQGLNIAKVSDMADKTWEAEHKGDGFTSHEQQNN